MAKYMDIDFNVTVRLDIENLPIDIRKELGRGMYDAIYDYEIKEVLQDFYRDKPQWLFTHFHGLLDEGDYITTDLHNLYVWSVDPEEVEKIGEGRS